MRKARQSGIERIESALVKIIQEKGADLDQTFSVRLLLLPAFRMLLPPARLQPPRPFQLWSRLRLFPLRRCLRQRRLPR